MVMTAHRSGAMRKLDFGDWPTAVTSTGAARAGLRLAVPADMWGPGKYRVLAQRRRQAQIRARHALDRQEAPSLRSGVRAAGRGAEEVR